MIPPVPRLVAWEITRRCNLRCRHCRASAEDCAYDGELTPGEAKAFIDDLSTFAKPILILTGGEPLLCEWIWEIIAYAKARGMKPVIGTNATLIDDDVAKRIASAGIPRISVSIDFPTAAAHDGFRGVDGAFDAALDGIASAIRAGVEVQINSTVTKLNVAELDRLHDLAASLGAKAFHPFLLVPTGRGKDLADTGLSPDEYERALEWVVCRSATSPMELKPTDAPQYQRILRQHGACPSHSTRGCLAGTGFAFIGHTGDVQPCGYFDMRLGNIRETPFSRIWAESPVLDDLRHPERLKGKCGVCEYRAVCGGCRARALAKTGDHLAGEPYCAHIPERWLMEELQTRFPLTERPYAELGRRLGCDEERCYGMVRQLREKGVLRRIGATLDPGRLGCVSTLVAFAVRPSALDAVAAKVNALPSVTHNYSRSGTFNLWFTLIARNREEIASTVAALAREPGVTDFMELPATRMYKLRTEFR